MPFTLTPFGIEWCFLFIQTIFMFFQWQLLTTAKTDLADTTKPFVLYVLCYLICALNGRGHKNIVWYNRVALGCFFTMASKEQCYIEISLSVVFCLSLSAHHSVLFCLTGNICTVFLSLAVRATTITLIFEESIWFHQTNLFDDVHKV